MLVAHQHVAPSTPGDRLVAQVQSLVLARLADDKLIIPAMPSTMSRCMELVRMPEFKMDDLVTIIEREPVVAAAAMRLANSSAYMTRGSVTNLRAALTRLGAKGTMKLVVEVTAEKLFVSRDVNIAGEASNIWRHSVAVAVASRDLRALFGGADAEEAYLAGLLHDIGKPVIAAILLEAERQIVERRGGKWINADQWRQVLKATSAQVGVAVAQKWQLPEQVLAAIQGSVDYNPADRQALSNAVCFANALADASGIATHPGDIAESKTMLMIGKSLLGITDELADRIRGSLPGRVTDLAMR